MVLKSVETETGGSWQSLIRKLLFLVLIPVFSLVYGQLVLHDLPLWQKDNSGIKEVRIFRNGELVALRQFRKDGKMAFQFVGKINSATEHQVHYFTKEGEMDTTILVSSRSGFLVFRSMKEKNTRKYYHNNSSGLKGVDLDRNVFFGQVRNIKDSTSLLGHRKVRSLVKEDPDLKQVSHLDDEGQELKSYQYHHGKLAGFTAKTGRDKEVKVMNNADGSPAGLSFEYEDHLLVSTKTSRTESFYGYNKDKKMVQLSTYELGKLKYATSNRYQGDKLLHRKFENLDTKKVIEYSFNYDGNGKLTSIVKHNSKKMETFTYAYSFW